jgi:hypothetical protein
MVQNIIVFVVIAAAIGNIVNGLRKLWLKRRVSSSTCGGCGNCSLKKDIVHHGHQ